MSQAQASSSSSEPTGTDINPDRFREIHQAFEASVGAGYPIELDVHASADDEVVVFHDDTLQRMTGVTGNVVRKGATFALTPAAAVGSVFTNGSVAIEGRLIDSTEGWSLFEFSDREKVCGRSQPGCR